MINPVTALPFTGEEVDRILGLADSFLEDWEQHEGADEPDCKERRIEFDAVRPLLVSAPALAQVAEWSLAAFGYLSTRAKSAEDRDEFRRRHNLTYELLYGPKADA